MNTPSPIPWYIEPYCKLVGFFALSAEEQRARIPNQCEPTYASFNEGDNHFTRPLAIIFYRLRDAAVSVCFHHGMGECSIIEEYLNDALLEAINALYDAPHYADSLDTAHLDEPMWNALRVAARDVWNTLDEAHRLPFGHSRDFAG